MEKGISCKHLSNKTGAAILLSVNFKSNEINFREKEIRVSGTLHNHTKVNSTKRPSNPKQVLMIHRAVKYVNNIQNIYTNIQGNKQNSP